MTIEKEDERALILSRGQKSPNFLNMIFNIYTELINSKYRLNISVVYLYLNKQGVNVTKVVKGL